MKENACSGHCGPWVNLHRGRGVCRVSPTKKAPHPKDVRLRRLCKLEDVKNAMKVGAPSSLG
jgi:hypothetical protein